MTDKNQSSVLAQGTVLSRVEAEARRYAEMYPQSSDGRNTFVIFADWVARLAAQPPAAPVETYNCPCGVGEEPCPRADGKPACANPVQRSSAGNVDELREEIEHAIRSMVTVTESTDAIMKILAAAPQQVEVWQPIEMAPKNHLPVQIYGPYGQLTAFRDVTWAWWSVPAYAALEYQPTHWKPLGPSPLTRGEAKQ